LVNVSVPVPVFARAPEPPITPLIVSVVLALTSNVPPPVSSAVARAEAKVAVVFSVPPLKLSGPVAAPRLSSAETCSVPALIVGPPL
jgi:hypothetical protein